MKTMILAVQVIEMVQGSAARPHPKAPAKVICEDRCIAFGIAAPSRFPR